jgi:glycosyltransferase involved in cell wall biosynthesis
MVAKVFLLHQICTLSKMYRVTLVTNLGEQGNLLDWIPDNVEVIDIPICREINLTSDLKVLFLLIKLFYKSNFSLTHSVSPKAGLLAMLSAFVTQVPVRLHTFTGQVWATKHGIGRKFLRWLDRLINALATVVLIDSRSQQNFLIENKVVKKSSSIVLGEGSISGVDLDRFRADPIVRKQVRLDLETPDNTIVFLFLGRIKKEKGILELAEAFSRIHQKYKNTTLWIVGPDEDSLRPKLEKITGICLIPFTNSPERYMAASDVFCLPSYREGFGSVIIEAGACGIPSIGSNIYGLSDAIVDGETGILISLKSVNELESAMELLVNDRKLCQKMGKAAYERSKSLFPQDVLTKQLVGLYKDLLQGY